MKIRKSWLALGVAISLAGPTTAFATNGYFAIGYGMNSKAMGGTAVANPQDAFVGATNPAGMARVGSRIDVGLELFVPPRRAAGQGIFTFSADHVESNDNLFPIPGFAINFDVSERESWGLTFIGNGANTSYQDNFFDLTGSTPPRPYGILGVELIQMQILPIYSYRIDDHHSVGVSPVIGLQVFKAYGLSNFATPDFAFIKEGQEGKFTNNGHSWSYGAGVRVGWLGQFLEDNKLTFGVAYSSKVYMSRFKQYTGLFAEHGDFDIPENYAAGFGYKFTPKLAMAFDVQRINYSNVKSVGNRHPTTSLQDPCTRPIDTTDVANFPTGCSAGSSLLPADRTSQKFGEDAGYGFGWTDQTAYKLGFRYALNKQWTLRAGYNYGKSPIPDDQLLFNMLAPAVTERFYTLGASYDYKGIADISFSFVNAPKTAQVCEAPSCTTMLSQNAGDFAAVELGYYAFGVGISMKF
jgi:long-chain fatty acid transport protein